MQLRAMKSGVLRSKNSTISHVVCAGATDGQGADTGGLVSSGETESLRQTCSGVRGEQTAVDRTNVTHMVLTGIAFHRKYISELRNVTCHMGLQC